jgi:hypothetical protein
MVCFSSRKFCMTNRRRGGGGSARGRACQFSEAHSLMTVHVHHLRINRAPGLDSFLIQDWVASHPIHPLGFRGVVLRREEGRPWNRITAASKARAGGETGGSSPENLDPEFRMWTKNGSGYSLMFNSLASSADRKKVPAPNFIRSF